ncbi:helix-turn-helix domain-containing protein [Companilactobacillus sp. HBUAS59544]|jgi:sugar diacid utilization regulator|uniref:helix-turn-helix domain-containing protein n=1 Tax=Companilactobacillus sp. HBUAS59544 TaxID=3109363 RepID=UPI002FEEA77E
MLGSIAKLLELYPDAKVVVEPSSDPDDYNFLIQDQWITIKKDHLSNKEKFLLSLVSQDNNNKSINNNWWNFLVHESDKIPSEKSNVRVLQFEVQKLESDDRAKEWLNVFVDTFDEVVDSFWINKYTGILIEKETKTNMDKLEVQRMIQLIDSDFYTKSRVYVGQFWPVNEKLPNIFDMERQLFHKSLEMKDNVNNLSTVILDFLIEQNLKNTDMFKSLKKKIDIDSKTTQMINALYKCDSNLTKTAKELFLHRNTLLYRMEKFHEQTGFDLKDRDDLVLCFLLLK